jgi:uncharacterized membrane-anchored protein YhcB (DUF1043 family)
MKIYMKRKGCCEKMKGHMNEYMREVEGHFEKLAALIFKQYTMKNMSETSTYWGMLF